MKTPKCIGPLTIYSWGFDIRLWRRLWFTVSRIDGIAYVSRDGTPTGAIWWLRGYRP